MIRSIVKGRPQPCEDAPKVLKQHPPLRVGLLSFEAEPQNDKNVRPSEVNTSSLVLPPKCPTEYDCEYFANVSGRPLGLHMCSRALRNVDNDTDEDDTGLK